MEVLLEGETAWQGDGSAVASVTSVPATRAETKKIPQRKDFSQGIYLTSYARDEWMNMTALFAELKLSRPPTITEAVSGVLIALVLVLSGMLLLAVVADGIWHLFNANPALIFSQALPLSMLGVIQRRGSLKSWETFA